MKKFWFVYIDDTHASKAVSYNCIYRLLVYMNSRLHSKDKSSCRWRVDCTTIDQQLHYYLGTTGFNLSGESKRVLRAFDGRST